MKDLVNSWKHWLISSFPSFHLMHEVHLNNKFNNNNSCNNNHLVSKKMSMSNHPTKNKISMEILDMKTIMEAIRIFMLWIFYYLSSLFELWIIFQFHFTLELCYLWLTFTLYYETLTMYVMLEFELNVDFMFC